MSKRVHTTKTKIRGGGDARPALDSSFVSRFGGTLKGKKARAALALAVSLWIANGGVASAYVYIDVTDNDTVKKTSENYDTVEPEIGTSNVKTLTASGSWWVGDLHGAKGAIDGDISGYTMIVAPDAKLNGVYGGWNTGSGNATGNTVIIGKGATIGDVGVSGSTVYDDNAKATGNTVELQGATSNGMVMGGWGGNSDRVSGNTLILSGENTVNGFYGVQNFETIKLSDVLEWNAGQTVLSATSNREDNFTNQNSSTKMTLDISAATKLQSATPGTMTLLSAGKDNAFDGFKLKDFASAEKTLNTTGTEVFNGEATNEKNGVTLAYDATHTVKLEDSNKTVTYNVTADPVKTVTIGEIAWNTSTAARTLTTEGLTFNGTTAIDASGLTLTGMGTTDPMSKSMTLLAGATNITGGHITQPGDGKGEVAVAYTDAKGVKLEAAAKGAVSVDSNDVKYTINSVNLNKATLGSFAWNDKDSLPEGWTASAATTIDATNFEYTGIAYDQVAEGTTSTILNAPGLTKDSKVEGGTKIEVAVENTDYDGRGIKFEATATGHVEVEVEATEQKVQYVVDSVALKNVDLGGWNGEVSGVPQNWTGSQVTVSTGNFNVPALAAGQSIDILTTSMANYFGTVSGDRKYSSETFENSEAGVTLSGNHFGGVKVEAYGEAANAKLTYYAETMGTTAITLGEMTWGTGRAAGTGYDFRNVGTIDATDLAFTFTDAQKAALSKDSKMTLLSGATNLAADKDVTGKDKTQTIDYSTANGAALTGTLKGIVSTSAGAVNYDATAMTLDSVNLAKWDGKTSSEVPEGWTASLGNDSVTAAGFTAPTIDADSSTDILTAETAIFNDAQITGAMKYKADAESSDTANGVTLTGAESKGVKVSDDGKSLVYARSNFNVSEISLEDMTWGKERALSGGCDFNNVADANISASNLKFSNPEDVTGTKTLLSGAANLAAGTNINHTQDFTKTANGAALSATLSGSVIRTTAGEIGYTATGTTLDAVDLANWNGTAASVPEGWTANADGVSVTGSFTAPTIAANTSKDVLTATDGIFTDAKIDDAIIYKQRETFGDDTAKGVTLSGVQSKGVKTADSGKSLVYAAGPMDVANVSLGAVDFEKGATLFDGSAASYNYANAAVNADSFSVSFATPETVAAGDNMTLLAANATLADMAVQSAKDVSYSVTPVTGVTLNAMINGSVGRNGNNIVYTATANKAAKLTFGDVSWLDTGALLTRPVNIDFNGAAVDTTKINFTNKDYLATDSKMTLVSDFGTAVGTITGTAFTVGKGTGEGHAYFESGSLRYLVTKGVTEPEPEPKPESDISGQTETVKPGETVTDNVVAAEATGNKTATSNTATVSNGGTVGAADEPANLTGATTVSGEATSNTASVSKGGAVTGNVTGAMTVSGEATKNTASVSGTVTGNVAGAETKSGDATDNMATITDGSKVTGSDPENMFAVVGARTESGKAAGNKATIAGSTVTGDVVGAVVTDGALSDGNAANVTGGSTVNGDVMGSFVDTGNITGNTANVEKNSTVNGDIFGAYSTDGDAVANHAVVSDSTVDVNTQSKCDGDVTGAQTENGVASGNTATVTGKNSKVAGQVAGGIISHEGEANSNEAHVSGATVGYGVYGGGSKDGSVVRNTATVDGGATVNGEVFGGDSDKGDASGNKAVVSDSTVNARFNEEKEKEANGDVAGAATNDGAASENTATVTNSTIEGNVYGGYSEKGTANDNEVEISGDKTEIKGTVYGGKSTEKSEGNTVTMTGGTVNKIVGGGCETATGNEVLLGGGKVTTAVYGGEATKTATNNSVTLYGTADVSTAKLYGGNLESTGNTLFVGRVLEDGTKSAWTGGGQSVGSVNNFETIQFDVVQWSEETPALTVGETSNLKDTTIDAAKVHFTGTDALAGKDEMTLLDQNAATSKAAEDNLNKESTFTAGTALQGKGTLSLDDKGNVKYTIDSVTSSDQSHNAVMGATVGMAALSMGNDFIGSATEGLSLSSNTGADGVSSFAKLGGGSMRQETGSHVDTHTWNAILALGHQNKKERGTFEYGAFFEYGTGNYTTHNGDERGDGSAKYTGGGVLAKWTAKHGFYVEGSLRAGTIHDDARNVLRDEVTHMPYSYETDAGYFGAHIGVGKEIALANGNVVDVYGKYFYNRRNGVSFDAGGDHYDLDAVTSQIVRIGARYTVKRDKWNYYAGAAYEHELDGKATGTANTFAISSADTSGASFRGEIGATMKPGENSPWQLDLNVAGFAGKKQGVTGGVSVSFMF